MYYPGVAGEIAQPERPGEAAYHVYIEVNSWVYDNYVFQRGGPVPLTEFQTNMLGGGAVWRQHETIRPGNPFDYLTIFKMIGLAKSTPRCKLFPISQEQNELYDHAITTLGDNCW